MFAQNQWARAWQHLLLRDLKRKNGELRSVLTIKSSFFLKTFDLGSPKLPEERLFHVPHSYSLTYRRLPLQRWIKLKAQKFFCLIQQTHWILLSSPAFGGTAQLPRGRTSQTEFTNPPLLLTSPQHFTLILRRQLLTEALATTTVNFALSVCRVCVQRLLPERPSLTPHLMFGFIKLTDISSPLRRKEEMNFIMASLGWNCGISVGYSFATNALNSRQEHGGVYARNLKLISPLIPASLVLTWSPRMPQLNQAAPCIFIYSLHLIFQALSLPSINNLPTAHLSTGGFNGTSTIAPGEEFSFTWLGFCAWVSGLNLQKWRKQIPKKKMKRVFFVPYHCGSSAEHLDSFRFIPFFQSLAFFQFHHCCRSLGHMGKSAC